MGSCAGIAGISREEDFGLDILKWLTYKEINTESGGGVNMREIQSLPVLFERVGFFLNNLDAIQKEWPSLTPEMRIAAVDRLFSHHSLSPLDVALADYQTILDIMYEAAAHGCPSGSTRMMGLAR
jgi:hypothetical protein